jgi:hypothetical protein
MPACKHRAPTPLAGAAECFRNCRLVSVFLLFFLGLLVPGIVIWCLERHTWLDYTQATAAAVAWPGGPPAAEVEAELVKLRRGPEGATEALDWRLAGVALLACVAVWQAAELAVSISLPPHQRWPP